MRLLVLGGTQFVGHAIVTDALARGWEVTTLNRGLSGSDVPGAEVIRGDRTQPGDLARLAVSGRNWDAVVDTSGYVPRDVLGSARCLEPVSAHYVFVSTVSVYKGWPREPLSEPSEVLYCPPDAGPDYGDDVEDGPTRYGYQKSGCETAVTSTFGPGRATILRPGVVLGPREHVGRLPRWLRRVAAGGHVLAPGEPGRSIQPADVRDLASFALRTVGGVFNITAPEGRETFGGLLRACAETTGSNADFIWVPDDQLIAHRIRQWSEMPLWRTFPGTWRVNSAAAAAAGLSSRPLSATVADTWSWMQQANMVLENERAAEIGISRQRENEILAGAVRAS